MTRWSSYSPVLGRMDLLPKAYHPDGTHIGVMAIHGAGTSAILYRDTHWGQDVRLFADEGYPVVSDDFGGFQTWGNDTAIAAADDAYDYLTGTLGALSGDDSVILYGISMGGCTALNWAVRNLSKVKAIVLIVPVVDLQDIHDNNRASFRSTIEAAYGSEAAFNAASPTHSPVEFGASLAGIPIRIWYGAVDYICVPATQLQFKEIVGSSCSLIEMVDTSHEMGPHTPTQVLRWINRVA